MSNVAVIEPRGKSVLLDMSDRYGMMPDAFEQTLRATVVPNNCTKEQFAAFLLVAKEYKLNPILKEIYAFPSRNGIQPIVGVDGWANLINSHPAFDGMDFEDHFNDGRELVSITCKMFRKDRSHPVTATEYLSECKRPTDPWKQWPRRMLRHKAMIQAARYAFSFAGIIDPDEAERFSGEFAQEIAQRVPLSERLAASGTVPANGFSLKHIETQTDSNSPDPSPDSQADKPATETSPLQPPVAGDLIQSSDGGVEGHASSTEDNSQQPLSKWSGKDQGSLEPPSAVAGIKPGPSDSLPEGWEIAYSDALKRAQSKLSLEKLAHQFWAEFGGWAMHKNGPNAVTAVAIFDAYNLNFGSKEAIAAALREVMP